MNDVGDVRPGRDGAAVGKAKRKTQGEDAAGADRTIHDRLFAMTPSMS